MSWYLQYILFLQARRDEMNKSKQASVATPTRDSTVAESVSPFYPRKTPRLQATRNLSASLENTSGSSPIITPQLSRISQPVNQVRVIDGFV